MDAKNMSLDELIKRDKQLGRGRGGRGGSRGGSRGGIRGGRGGFRGGRGGFRGGAPRGRSGFRGGLRRGGSRGSSQQVKFLGLILVLGNVINIYRFIFIPLI